MRRAGISDFSYADYAVTNDTHMEVQLGLLNFPTAADAADWATAFMPGIPDSNGIAGAYLPVGGTPAAGVYHYVFSSGPYGALLVCRSSIDGEAASRECEDPLKSTALAWKLSLGALRQSLIPTALRAFSSPMPPILSLRLSAAPSRVSHSPAP